MTDTTGSAVVHNGEIYNYRELRSELSSAPFRTASDTEVLLRAYRRWGLAALDRLRGMFAFALWDEPRQTLVCARDRCGTARCSGSNAATARCCCGGGRSRGCSAG